MRIILASKTEGELYANMSVYPSHVDDTDAKISELRAQGYVIFFVMDCVGIVDDALKRL